MVDVSLRTRNVLGKLGRDGRPTKEGLVGMYPSQANMALVLSVNSKAGRNALEAPPPWEGVACLTGRSRHGAPGPGILLMLGQAS